VAHLNLASRLYDLHLFKEPACYVLPPCMLNLKHLTRDHLRGFFLAREDLRRNQPLVYEVLDFLEPRAPKISQPEVCIYYPKDPNYMEIKRHSP